MKKLGRSKVGKAATAAMVCATLAFGQFFSSEAARAKGWRYPKCTAINLRSIVDSDTEWKGNGNKCGKLKELVLVVRDYENTKTTTVMIPCRHVKEIWDDYTLRGFDTMLRLNIDRGYKRRMWNCRFPSRDLMKPGLKPRVRKVDGTDDYIVYHPKDTPPILDANDRPFRKSEKGAMLEAIKKNGSAILVQRMVESDSELRGRKINVLINVKPDGEVERVAFRGFNGSDVDRKQVYLLARIIERLRFRSTSYKHVVHIDLKLE